MSAQPQLPLDHRAAVIRREVGMDRVGAKVEALTPGWLDAAFVLLQRFAAEQRKPFLTEDFRSWAHAHGLELPHDGRAFGPVLQRAARDGLIARAGFAPASSSNRSPKPLWQVPRVARQGRAA